MHKRDLLKGLTASAGLSLLAGCANVSTRARLPSAPSQIPRVSLGIDELVKGGFAPLKGRRVGFITNQTSMSGAGIMSRRILQQGIGTDLRALFGPEHGLDTRARAGDHVANSVDPVTGLRALSLYGPTRKPSPQMLADLDVVVFEIQDIGVRSYTYISTMALAMEACGEAGKDFIVLDRPNPMGGELVQGPPMESAFLSFVGQVPVPYRHGLTIGELAKMIISKGWIKANPRLSVIPMQGWERSMTWEDTGLPWVATSPNIPNPSSPLYCAATGILGELRGVDIGIGTSKPFHYAAAPGIDGNLFASDLSAMGFEGVRFLPYQSVVKPGFSGVELIIDPRAKTDIMALGIALIVEVVRRTNGSVLAASPRGAQDLFQKVYGSLALDQALKTGGTWQNLVASWRPSLDAFMEDRAPFLLYR